MGCDELLSRFQTEDVHDITTAYCTVLHGIYCAVQRD